MHFQKETIPNYGRAGLMSASDQQSWVIREHGAPMGGNKENNLGVFLVFLFYVCLGLYGVFILPKWLIKVPGPMPILFK